MNIGAALSKKYGPLPGSVWLLLVFCVGFLLIKRSQKKGAGSSTSGAGDVSYISGEGNKVGYTTTSNTTSNIGPGAGGSFEGSYWNKGPTTVDMPFTSVHTGVSPDFPSRHHTWKKHRGNGQQDNHQRQGHGDGAYLDHGVWHDKHGNHIGHSNDHHGDNNHGGDRGDKNKRNNKQGGNKHSGGGRH